MEQKAHLARIYRWLELITALIRSDNEVTIAELTEMAKRMRGTVRTEKRDEVVDKRADELLVSLRREQLKEALVNL